jgi:uncharacterized protein (DUF1501 family)
MKRRSFIQTGSMLSVPFLLKGMEVSTINSPMLMDLIAPENDKILVLVQLGGGNDGLSTFIPLDRYDNLMAVRKDIMIPQANLIKVTDKNTFHHRLVDFSNIFKDGQMSVVQSVSYPNHNRSHFRSTDIWTQATDANQYVNEGWLGRQMQMNHPSFPEGYPNTQYVDPFAITMSSVVSETCQGTVTNFSYAVANPTTLTKIPITENGTVDDTYYGQELNYLQNAFNQSNSYADSVSTKYNKGTNKATYPTSGLATQLRYVARMVAGGLQTKIYVVNLGGFDTHDSQTNGTDTLNGRYATLMDTLSKAIGAFQSDLKMLGVDKRVVGMTFSEFGRRIKANNSFGTDHGTAAPLFVFGSCVKGGIIGESPAISATVTNDEGVAMQYDFRSIYASLLIDWFQVPKADVKRILYKDFQHLPIIEGCQTTDIDDVGNLVIEATAYPNPAQSYTTVKFEATGQRSTLSIFDSIGSLIRLVYDKDLDAGQQEVLVPLDGLNSGVYYLRLTDGVKQKAIKIVVY